MTIESSIFGAFFFYFPALSTAVQTDLSDIALGAILLEANKDGGSWPVDFTSRKINPMEIRCRVNIH